MRASNLFEASPLRCSQIQRDPSTHVHKDGIRVENDFRLQRTGNKHAYKKNCNISIFLLKLSRTRCRCCKLDVTPIQQEQLKKHMENKTKTKQKKPSYFRLCATLTVSQSVEGEKIKRGKGGEKKGPPLSNFFFS